MADLNPAMPFLTVKLMFEHVRTSELSAAPMNRFKDRYQCIVFGSDAHVTQAIARLNQISPLLRLIEGALG